MKPSSDPQPDQSDWAYPLERGICFGCGQLKDCMSSNLGWVCRQCFRDFVFDKKQPPGYLTVPPKKGAKAFMLIDRANGQMVYITVNGVLYAFQTLELALEMLDHLKKEIPDVCCKIEEDRLDAAFAYTCVYNLSLVAIAGKLDPLKEADKPSS